MVLEKRLIELRLTCERYARALRVIGQDLADLYPDRLAVEVDGGNLIARGRRRVPAQEVCAKSKKLRRFWRRSSEPESKARSAEFERTYTPEAIDNLVESAIRHRSGTLGRPDLYSIAEKLRMIGRILDEKDAELLKLCLDPQRVTFHYRDNTGTVHTEECSHLDLYKLQQQFSETRAVDSKDAWQMPRR